MLLTGFLKQGKIFVRILFCHCCPMKNVQINGYGGNEVITVNEITLGSNLALEKVLVKVKAAGVNPVDWKIRQGFLQQIIPLSFPATLGGDFSGEIMATGEGVLDFKKGDKVYGQASVLGGGTGSFAEQTIVDIKTIAFKPQNLDHLKASALPLAGVSALQGLTEHIGLSKDQKILIHGGAGGIGTFAIQLAKHLSAFVATTVREDHIDYVKSLGADEVIDYKNQSFEDLLQNFDAVLDLVGGETYVRSFKVLKKGGVIVSLVEAPRDDLRQQYGVKAVLQFTQVDNKRLATLAKFCEEGMVKVFVDRIFPLEETGEALAYLQNGHPRGKVVLDIDKNQNS